MNVCLCLWRLGVVWRDKAATEAMKAQKAMKAEALRAQVLEIERQIAELEA